MIPCVTTSEKAIGNGRPKSKLSELARRVVSAGSRPVSPASLAAFRIAFGILCLVATIRFVAMGWVSELYIEPVHHFSYFGFGWVKPWPGWGMYLHFAAGVLLYPVRGRADDDDTVGPPVRHDVLRCCRWRRPAPVSAHLLVLFPPGGLHHGGARAGAGGHHPLLTEAALRLSVGGGRHTGNHRP